MMHSNNKSTGVFWDMEQCQVPRGYDPYQVRQSIESALKDYLPFTISAIGNLKRVPPRVLVPIFSIGSADIASIILLWTHDNPPPATLILISDNEELYVNSELIPLLRDRGYTILRVFGNRPKFSHSYYHQTFLWKHFFQGLRIPNRRQQGRRWLRRGAVELVGFASCAFLMILMDLKLAKALKV